MKSPYPLDLDPKKEITLEKILEVPDVNAIWFRKGWNDFCYVFLYQGSYTAKWLDTPFRKIKSEVVKEMWDQGIASKETIIESIGKVLIEETETEYYVIKGADLNKLRLKQQMNKTFTKEEST